MKTINLINYKFEGMDYEYIWKEGVEGFRDDLIKLPMSMIIILRTGFFSVKRDWLERRT